MRTLTNKRQCVSKRVARYARTMWEMMLSWWWIRPLPTLDTQKIPSKNPFKIKNKFSFTRKSDDRSKKLKLAAALRVASSEEDEVKFLYESKSGKSNRRSMVLSDHEPDTISNATKPYLDELIMENR